MLDKSGAPVRHSIVCYGFNKTPSTSEGIVLTNDEVARRYCRVSKAAQRMGCLPPIVHRELQRGKIDGVCIDGYWLIEIASLERYIKARAHKSTPAAAVAVAR